MLAEGREYDEALRALVEATDLLDQAQERLPREYVRLPRVYECGTMDNGASIALADKPDDSAPYFSLVLVPGWSARP